MISFVDQEKCTGCGLCFKSCPLDVFRLSTAQASVSPCTAGCPAGTDIRGCHYLIQQGRFDEALALWKKASPLPGITGRVCFHPCEGECTRAGVDEAVNINALEQFLGDLDLESEQEALPLRHISPVAVIGSGPGGLACAWHLAEAGYPVTVFEAMPRAGGMLRYGIPAWRMPDDVLDRQVNKLQAAGIQFCCDSRQDSLERLEGQGFKAICLALGAAGARLPGIPCENAANVVSGLEYLLMARQGRGKQPGRCVVVGGGNVAMDAAVSAKRLGASQVDLICLEQKDAMPAFAHSIDEAVAEGVIFHYGLGPVAVRTEHGLATGLECRPCLSLYDSEGRFAPQLDASVEHFFAADTVILAIGQRVEPGDLAQRLNLQRGLLAADPVTRACSRHGVFAAGDAAEGPSSVIQAVVSGQKAAAAIDRFLSGRELHQRPASAPKVADIAASGLDLTQIPHLPRQKREHLPSLPDIFTESRRGFDLSRCMAEAARCLTCGSKAVIAYDDDCMTCYTCEVRCPAGAVHVHPFKEPLPCSLELAEVKS